MQGLSLDHRGSTLETAVRVSWMGVWRGPSSPCYRRLDIKTYERAALPYAVSYFSSGQDCSRAIRCVTTSTVVAVPVTAQQLLARSGCPESGHLPTTRCCCAVIKTAKTVPHRNRHLLSRVKAGCPVIAARLSATASCCDISCFAAPNVARHSPWVVLLLLAQVLVQQAPTRGC